jgi:signal transduction histidine kinase
MMRMSGPHRSRSTVIVVILVATLVMTGALAWEALQAARSHRATAENVLRDYSRFAAWELTRLGRQQVLNALNTELSRVQRGVRAGNPAAALGESSGCGSGCGGTYRVTSVFSTAIPQISLAVTGMPLGADATAFLQKSIETSLRKPHDFTCPALEVVSIDGAPAVLVWRPVHEHFDRVSGVVGFVADLPFLTGLFKGLVEKSPLLPASLVPPGKSPNTALAVRVLAPNETTVFESAADWSPYRAGERFTRDLGGLELQVALRSEAADTLVIGGLPRERLPLVLGVLTVTAALVVVALVQLRREAELSRLRAEFVSGVSHELRTPLAQIRMFTETLLLGRVRSATESRRSLEIVARETQRLIQLVENVLVFSRGERRAPQLSREATRLAPVVLDVVANFAPLADSRQARITTAVDEQLAASVDPGALRRILLNLLDNAVKYGPPAQTVQVSLVLEGDHAVLAVADEGPGIDARDARQIWEPFNRLARSADATGGTGIGLSIVRQLTELHGGRAVVERPPSGGARFVIELPGAWREAGAAAVA